MRRRRSPTSRLPLVRRLTLALATGVIAAAVPVGSAAGARVAFIDCDHTTPARQQPKEIILACGDGNAQLVNLKWRTWGGAAAVASGRAAINDCTPSCVGGKFHAYPMLVKLERIKTCEGLRQYTRLTIIYTGNPFPSGPHRLADPRGCATPGR